MKNMPIFRSTVAVVMFLTVAGVQAAPFNVLGFNDMSCAVWQKSKDDPDQRSAFVVWSRGLLTGHNYALPAQQVSTISSGTIEQYINQYCAKTPNGLFSDAVLRLSDQYSGRNQPIRK